MNMNMHIVAVVVVIMSFAPCTHASTGPCTLPANLGTSGWKIIGGNENDDTAVACVASATLVHGTSCWVMPEAGYTSNAATATATSYTCTDTALNTNVNLEVTGCKEHYHMSAGSSNTDIVCTACEPGKTIATMLVSSGVQTCTADCVGATAGSCAMGCADNFYQSSGTTSSDIKCTACSPGTKHQAKAVMSTEGDVCSACDGSVPGDCSTGCAANFYQGSGNVSDSSDVSEITCTACGSGTNIAAMPVQDDATSCAVTTTITTTMAMNDTQNVCTTPSNATNATMIATYVQCLGTECEDAEAQWLEGLSTVPVVTCASIIGVNANDCSKSIGSALGLLMANTVNKSLDADIAQAVETFTLDSLCCKACGNDGASTSAGTTDGNSALVSAAPTTGPSIAFLTLAPTTLLLSIMCL